MFLHFTRCLALPSAIQYPRVSVNASGHEEGEDLAAAIQASCPAGSAVFLQRIATERQIETTGIVNEELSTGVSIVGVIASASALATAGIGHVLNPHDKEKFTVLCPRDNPGFRLLALRRPGRPGVFRRGRCRSRKKKKSRRPEIREGQVELRDQGPLRSVLRDQDQGRSSVEVGGSVGFGSQRAA